MKVFRKTLSNKTKSIYSPKIIENERNLNNEFQVMYDQWQELENRTNEITERKEIQFEIDDTNYSKVGNINYEIDLKISLDNIIFTELKVGVPKLCDYQDTIYYKLQIKSDDLYLTHSVYASLIHKKTWSEDEKGTTIEIGYIKVDMNDKSKEYKYYSKMCSNLLTTPGNLNKKLIFRIRPDIYKNVSNYYIENSNKITIEYDETPTNHIFVDKTLVPNRFDITYMIDDKPEKLLYSSKDLSNSVKSFERPSDFNNINNIKLIFRARYSTLFSDTQITVSQDVYDNLSDTFTRRYIGSVIVDAQSFVTFLEIQINDLDNNLNIFFKTPIFITIVSSPGQYEGVPLGKEEYKISFAPSTGLLFFIILNEHEIPLQTNIMTNEGYTNWPDIVQLFDGNLHKIRIKSKIGHNKLTREQIDFEQEIWDGASREWIFMKPSIQYITKSDSIDLTVSIKNRFSGSRVQISILNN